MKLSNTRLIGPQPSDGSLWFLLLFVEQIDREKELAKTESSYRMV